MKRGTVFTIVGGLLCGLVLVWAWNWRGNPDALWHIVSQQCVPNQQQQHKPDPCLAVDLEHGFTLLKDRNGPVHDLLIPVNKVTGIEEAALGSQLLPHYFAQAWQHRNVLSDGLNKAIPDQFVSVAINSRYGRTQNQLHVHIACLRPAVFAALNQQSTTLDEQWRVLPTRLMGHTYSARTLPAADVDALDPFALLREYVQARGDSMSQYGLLMTPRADGRLVLLTTHLAPGELNRGSAEELQDPHCDLMNPQQASLQRPL
ncbi:CDP-diacylglycerol diphosphatase [Pseudomonas costantinii]|uniref:CDP-diacylglycerol pyrophosphatase n=1 Tax=Pseudomonas costantinii TaxID=168469 RepID=A0A1S2V5J0_9PSED|nr:CDP-diacylglycerol diphosphatase [Pseudomonas costantinii]NVZ23446.1 CDP-diacylglycerol diphosphatase [Pseudomonas costantinii]OIN53949.1 CDP-diacylglycerol diphosphatase [Pseudomonas costantinii]SED18729.1 CDP-diacylglycerol pyrophosphatase [Pseudomonas costantinii]